MCVENNQFKFQRTASRITKKIFIYFKCKNTLLNEYRQGFKFQRPEMEILIRT